LNVCPEGVAMSPRALNSVRAADTIKTTSHFKLSKRMQ